MRQLLWRIIFVFAWIGAQAYLFTTKFVHIMSTEYLATMRKVSGPTLAVSRASALMINFNSALILFCCCRITLTWLRGLTIVHKLGIPLDDAIGMHKLVGYSIVLFSMLHAVGHYINYVKFAHHSQSNVWLLLFLNNTGLSGHLLLVIILLMVGMSVFKKIRSKSYELFYYVHKLFYAYFVLISIHGAFCFIKTDDPINPCIAPQSWKWVIPGLTLYILEQIYSFFRAHRFTYASKVILHQSSVFEIQMRKPSFSFTPGQYVYLKVPASSFFQWHPFTITSAPEDQFISVHIRVVGDWTLCAAECFGIKQDLRTGKLVADVTAPKCMPRVFIDGPYGAPCQDFSKHEVVVCIGGGIGQTPFSSVLRSIWYNVVHPTEEVELKKIIYIGICRSVTVKEVREYHVLYSVGIRMVS